jgi:hypothetical protein
VPSQLQILAVPAASLALFACSHGLVVVLVHEGPQRSATHLAEHALDLFVAIVVAKPSSSDPGRCYTQYFRVPSHVPTPLDVLLPVCELLLNPTPPDVPAVHCESKPVQSIS